MPKQQIQRLTEEYLDTQETLTSNRLEKPKHNITPKNLQSKTNTHWTVTLITIITTKKHSTTTQLTPMTQVLDQKLAMSINSGQQLRN